MAKALDGKKVAILVTDFFEQVELTDPRAALEAEGADVDIVALSDGPLQAMKHRVWGDTFPVDVQIDQASPDDYDALVLPGGVINPDRLRMDERAVSFVRSFVAAEKPVAAICHGPAMLIEADVVRNRRATSFPSLKTDLRNAGADWVDQEVVEDGVLITSRTPDDLPAFNRTVIEAIKNRKK